MTRRQVLPFVIADCELGEHVLELGAGPGAGTAELRRRAPRVTSLEYDAKLVRRLRMQVSKAGAHDVAMLQGDAAELPFPAATFSAAIAILMLHHLKSREQQDRAFAEIFRVLRPGGAFLALEIQNSWSNRLGHIKSTFVPLEPEQLSCRLARAGFAQITFSTKGSAYRLRALHPHAV
jgi:ubiquinone/menaquinone biosynthesis C-methylase UbiE